MNPESLEQLLPYVIGCGGFGVLAFGIIATLLLPRKNKRPPTNQRSWSKTTVQDLHNFNRVGKVFQVDGDRRNISTNLK